MRNFPAPLYISLFESLDPLYQASQEQILEFLQKENPQVNPKFLARYGVKSHQVSKRYFECPDMFVPVDNRLIYGKHSADIQKRTLFFSDRAAQIFHEFYKLETSAPDHLIHVTCTGYVSPSAAQVCVAAKNWSSEITHAYHMGCYGSLPAMRIAWGQCLLGKRTDIIHTEMCSLNLDPADWSPEQIVVQTLFADGHIKYQASLEKVKSGFAVRHIKEKILPDTGLDMTWMPGSSGMKMTLSKDVPRKVSAQVRDFVMSLISEAGLSFPSVMSDSIFALHPGGPKIIDTLAEALELNEEQIQASRQILLERGNMSSATLPHIWERILNSNTDSGTVVVSLGFGPGLTMFGAVFEVC